jgi:hypothetical protein
LAALGVGQPKDECPLSLVRCADFSRTEYSCLCSVTHALQFSEHMEQNRSSGRVAPSISLEFLADNSFDVLQENNGRSCDSDSFEDGREEVSRIGVRVTSPRC